MLRWLKTVVVSDREKACLTRQVGARKTFQNLAGMTRGAAVRSVVRLKVVAETEGLIMLSGRAWQGPVYGPGGTRRKGDVSLACRSCTERGKASGDTRRDVHMGHWPPARGEGACRGRKPRH